MRDAPVHMAFIEYLGANHLHDVPTRGALNSRCQGIQPSSLKVSGQLPGALGAEFGLVTGS
jgi:hypothetical protein